MSLRLRILLATAILVVVPLLLYGWRVRREMDRHLTTQYREQMETVAALVQHEIDGTRVELGARLAALRPRLDDDNRFRLGLLGGGAADREYLRDYGEATMELTGLSMLQIEDETGRILTSGHYRDEYDRIDRTPEFLARAPEGTALVLARGPNDLFLALARVDSLEIGGRRLTVTAGVEIGSRFLFRLAPDRDATVSLVYPGGARSGRPAIQDSLRAHTDADTVIWSAVFPPDRYLVREIPVPFLTTAPDYELTSAEFLVAHGLDRLEDTRENLTFWLLASLAVITAGTLLFAGVLSHILTRPIRELARRTAEFNLDNPDTRFASGGAGEVGTLSKFLDAMTSRLRASAERLREVERRATLGEVARQVNHDLRNGLTPIRNVLRHLAQVADESPEQLRTVFAERRHTLEASIGYLEQLAQNYARLSPPAHTASCDLNRTARQVAGLLGSSARSPVIVELGDVPPVEADPIAIRRILENLIRNGIESRDDGAAVTVRTERATGEAGIDEVLLTVADDGPGMSEAEQERIFDDFYTTKEGGAGLGLSIVRRLVADAGGRIRVRSEPERGTVFSVRLPAAVRRGGDDATESASKRGDNG